MILGKFWHAIRAQINKVANIFWEADPIAQMQYEYDTAVEQLKQGRTGLETYRALVERVTRNVAANRAHVQQLEADTKAYLKSGQRDTAAKFALELQKAKTELKSNEDQLALHETAYENNLKKIQNAGKKLADVKQKIQKYDADLKMSSAEAEVAALAQSFDFNVTTDFGQLDDGSFFLVLEFVEGQSLRDALGHGRLELGRSLHITLQIANALQRARSMSWKSAAMPR